MKPWPHNPTQLPYVKGSETSKAAADSMITAATGIKHRIYNHLLALGEHGATDDEVEVALDLTHQTASSRRRNLELVGAVRKTTDKRRTRSGREAFVYVAVPAADLTVTLGRPRKAPGELHNVKVTAYLTQDQHADLCMMAANRDQPPGKLLRMAWAAYFDSSLWAPDGANRTESGPTE